MFSFEGWDISKRGPQIQVYGVGVGKANMTDLSRVTAHVTNRLVHINTFRDLAALGRWLETSVDLTHNGKSEETMNLWTREAVETNFACRMTCSKHAQCYCSLRTGQTLCTCLPGFYGNGMQCTACPRGTYKEDSSAQRHCIPCPAHTGTRARGTTSFKMCKPGFGRDIQQALKKCPELPVVAHASKFGVDYLVSTAVRNTGQHCSNMAGTSCHFQCHRNFRLIGYPGLMCEWEGLWLGILPRCVRTSDSDCGTLFELGQQDLHGKTTYFNSSSSSSSSTNGNTNRPPVFAPTFPRYYDDRNNPDERFDLQHMAGYPFADLDYEYSHYENRFRGGRNTSTHQGAIVRVTCPPGWMTIGDPERSCLPHGVWSLTPAHCVDMQCPPIPRTEGLRIFPRTCAQNRQAVGTECSLTCQSGFRLVGSGNVTCNNRRWTSNVLNIANKPEDVFGICIDTEPPHITCHRNLTLHVSRRYIRLLYWEDVQPIVSDNSGHVTVTSPDLPGSPFPVYLGHSTIRFMAKDKYHSSTCTMGIKVIDPNVQAVMCPTTEVEIQRVHAISPLVLPNVVRFARMDSRGREAESVNHLCNPANESLVGLGQHSVSCWAYIDQGPLGAQCNFSVNIKRKYSWLIQNINKRKP
ncbi:sushi, von Willebrand factor type a, egf and pentraxin domain-containing protein 1 [Plakobranchus ocellatus]|uniref:Sushi, von Willebrand factor type a, egf and pentraxin domain-containing protein 1 n=1 Tax=Plakobranchus ocellatus TaxID=259542 RepID=A0AAV4DGS1_9GAST|nr:sushi, von Willebrand factor type a, egf and pentraxin domain-containing protein 1 [Plakobranchus ocellatus]